MAVPRSSKQRTDSPTLRVFALLQLIVRADRPVSLSDATAALGQPKPTVHRMFALLEEAGLVIREPDGKRYSPSRLLVRFGLEILWCMTLARHATSLCWMTPISFTSIAWRLTGHFASIFGPVRACRFIAAPAASYC